MDRFLTFEGRQPVWLDDFEFMQNAVSDEFKKLIQGLTETTDEVIILTGCEESYNPVGNKVAFSAGVIAYKGELLAVKSSSVILLGTPVFAISTEIDSAGDRTMMESGVDVSCYSRRTVRIINQVKGGESLPAVRDCKRLEDILKARTAEDVLYDDVSGEFHITLIRKDGTYLLHCEFSGVPDDLHTMVPMTDTKAMEDLCISYNAWNHSATLVPWQIGESFDSCAYEHDSDDGVYLTCNTGIVIVRTLSAHPDYPDSPWVLDIAVKAKKIDEGFIRGGFTMMLHNRNRR